MDNAQDMTSENAQTQAMSSNQDHMTNTAANETDILKESKAETESDDDEGPGEPIHAKDPATRAIRLALLKKSIPSERQIEAYIAKYGSLHPSLQQEIDKLLDQLEARTQRHAVSKRRRAVLRSHRNTRLPESEVATVPCERAQRLCELANDLLHDLTIAMNFIAVSATDNEDKEIGSLAKQLWTNLCNKHYREKLMPFRQEFLGDSLDFLGNVSTVVEEPEIHQADTSGTEVVIENPPVPAVSIERLTELLRDHSNTPSLKNIRLVVENELPADDRAAPQFETEAQPSILQDQLTADDRAIMNMVEQKLHKLKEEKAAAEAAARIEAAQRASATLAAAESYKDPWEYRFDVWFEKLERANPSATWKKCQSCQSCQLCTPKKLCVEHEYCHSCAAQVREALSDSWKDPIPGSNGFVQVTMPTPAVVARLRKGEFVKLDPNTDFRSLEQKLKQLQAEDEAKNAPAPVNSLDTEGIDKGIQEGIQKARDDLLARLRQNPQMLFSAPTYESDLAVGHGPNKRQRVEDPSTSNQGSSAPMFLFPQGEIPSQYPQGDMPFPFGQSGMQMFPPQQEYPPYQWQGKQEDN